MTSSWLRWGERLEASASGRSPLGGLTRGGGGRGQARPRRRAGALPAEPLGGGSESPALPVERDPREGPSGGDLPHRAVVRAGGRVLLRPAPLRKRGGAGIPGGAGRGEGEPERGVDSALQGAVPDRSRAQ